MNSRKFVICINNKDYPASLEKGKVYQVLSDPEAESGGEVRIIDESGEDYLFPTLMFVDIALNEVAEAALFTSA